MCSACRLMVFNVCVKFHENMLSGFKVMERTRKLSTDTHTHTHTHTHTYTHTQRKDENIIPHGIATYAGVITICPSPLHGGGIKNILRHNFTKMIKIFGVILEGGCL